MRYFVTGGSGHTGSAVVACLASLDDTERVIAADIVPSTEAADIVDSMVVDVRDGDKLASAIETSCPDAIVHMAASHDVSNGRETMYETNVAGTNGVLAAASAVGTQHVLVVSSAACYEAGASDGPVDEAAPQSSKLASNRARDRATVDRLSQLWAARLPDRKMTIVRPCAVVGSAPDDATLRLFTEPPFPAAMADPRTAVQLLHEDDFVAAIALLASGGHSGPFNVSGDDSVELGTCAELIGQTRSRGARRAYSKLRHRRAAKELFEELDLLVGTPRLDTSRIRGAGWAASHTSRGAFEAALRARRETAYGPAPAPIPLMPDVVPEHW